MTGTSQGEAPERAEARPKVVELPSAISVKELAGVLGFSAVDTIKRLMRRGVMANINEIVNFETAASVAVDFGLDPRPEPVKARRASRIMEAKKKRQALQAEEHGGMKPRPPVVTIMGHVNHGKTRLLDSIRKTNVVDQEAGGITQHIGAYQAEVGGQKMTFLDTPGHEAFTAMRAHGAQVTDITILVVAADDGVMPQTLEAIDHAKAAGVPIVVAINKIDLATANVDLVKQQLADAGLVAEEWGGDTVCVPIAAKEGTGVPELLENLMVVAELEDLKADPTRPADGVVVEAEMDRSRGAMATVLVHSGTLRVGDIAVVGENWGRIKAMFNEAGKRVKRATPSTPVSVLGLDDVPQVGGVLSVVSSDRQAQGLIAKHREAANRQRGASKGVSLTNLYDQVHAGQVSTLNIVLKTDVQGSIEPIRTSLEQLAEESAKVHVIHAANGNVTESDVMLAAASSGVIIGFNVVAEAGARLMAETEGVSIRYYDVIYSVIDDVTKALQGMLEPTFEEVIQGRAEVRAVFSAGKRDKAAGSYITEGRVTRGASVRVVRKGKLIQESTISGLRRFKDDVREVAAGIECGIAVQGFNDFEVGDILEVFSVQESN